MSQINQNNEKIEKENRGEVRVLDARPLTRVWHLEVRRHLEHLLLVHVDSFTFTQEKDDTTTDSKRGGAKYFRG